MCCFLLLLVLGCLIGSGLVAIGMLSVGVTGVDRLTACMACGVSGPEMHAGVATGTGL